MRLLKPLAAGLFAAVLGILLSIALVAVPQLWQQGAFSDESEGVGALAISISGLPIMAAALVGFVLGFAWMRRRMRRRGPSS